MNLRRLALSSLPPFLHSSLPALLIVGLLLIGCSAMRSVSQHAAEPAGNANARFVRRINPFPVYGAEGKRFDFPFLGGLKVPRPQLVDIDLDGDLDLFLQEETGSVMFFENTGTPTDPNFTFRTEKYRGLDVGSWYRFADLDQDGDFDLLAEQPYSYIRYYRNTGTPGEPHFTLAADTLLSASGEPIFSDRQNIPNVSDIDCDGRKDLFIGRLDGTVTRYEEVPTDGPVPRFQLIADNFEDIRIIGQQFGRPGQAAPMLPPPGGGPQGPSALNARAGRSLHGANTLAFADVDGDGDLDLLWGDYFEPGLLLLENTGSCQTTSLADPQPFPPPDPLATSGYNAPTFGDLDGDGDPDFLVGVIGGAYNPSRTARENLYYYEKVGPHHYELRTRRFLDGIDIGGESHPAVADLDADGDLDFLLGNKISGAGSQTGRVFRYENTGTPTQPSYRIADTLSLAPAYNYAPALADLDADGDLDLAVGTWNEGIDFYRNTGTAASPSFARDTTWSVPLPTGSHHTPAFADLDADGDLDLVVGETAGTLTAYRNTGTPQEPQFERAPDLLPDIDVGRRSAPALTDLDGDGDADLVVGTESNGLVVFRNTGTPTNPDFERTDVDLLPGDAPGLATPAFADLYSDGALDLLIGTSRGGLVFFEGQ